MATGTEDGHHQLPALVLATHSPHAQYTPYSRNNIVANLGGQWNPAESGLNPTYNYEVEADHLSINLMMTHKVLVQGKSQSFSPIDLLNQYYLNNLKLINTFQ